MLNSNVLQVTGMVALGENVWLLQIVAGSTCFDLKSTERFYTVIVLKSS